MNPHSASLTTAPPAPDARVKSEAGPCSGRPDRREILRQMAASLRVAAGHWAEDGPEDICRRTEELEMLRSQWAAAPETAAENEARAAEMLRALAAAAREVRRINDVYMALLSAAQRSIGLRLRHLSGYAPVYARQGAAAAGTALDPLFWDRQAREARA